MKYAAFIGFGNEHLPVPIVKSTMKQVWEKEKNLVSYFNAEIQISRGC